MQALVFILLLGKRGPDSDPKLSPRPSNAGHSSPGSVSRSTRRWRRWPVFSTSTCAPAASATRGPASGTWGSATRWSRSTFRWVSGPAAQRPRRLPATPQGGAPENPGGWPRVGWALAHFLSPLCACAKEADQQTWKMLRDGISMSHLLL